MKILAIVNLFSGKGKGREYLKVLQNELKDGNELKIYLTKDKPHTVNFVKNYCRDFDMIVVVGGDGTLNEVVNGCMAAKSDVPVGYIPAGSTNDFATTLKLVRDPVEACRSFLKMNTKPLDVGVFNGRYFTYVAAAGAFSETSYATSTELKNKLGHFAYILGGIASVPTIRPQHMRVEVDGRVFEGDYLLTMISNSTSVGGVFSYEDTLVSLDDGKFEIALLREPEMIYELGSLLKDVLLHKYNGDYIEFASGSHIRIDSPKEIPWSLDGEFGGAYTAMEIDNIHKALKLLI